MGTRREKHCIDNKKRIIRQGPDYWGYRCLDIGSRIRNLRDCGNNPVVVAFSDGKIKRGRRGAAYTFPVGDQTAFSYNFNMFDCIRNRIRLYRDTGI